MEWVFFFWGGGGGVLMEKVKMIKRRQKEEKEELEGGMPTFCLFSSSAPSLMRLAWQEKMPH